ncbi:MAG TPA: type IV pilus twitching motility protein PilT [Gemmatimonadales bacterium]|nr:type IV pilus twitching motility protein PilT [Gemmatimonadales bacterium]
MARLDRFIQVMQEQGAQALELRAGRPASLLTSAGPRPISREALTPGQIVSLVRELAPAPLQAQVEEGGSFAFPYSTGATNTSVEGTSTGGFVVVIRPNGAASPAAAPAGAAPAPALRPSIAVNTPAPDLSQARARLDSMLRQTAEGGASDLHLRSGDKPLIRADGEMKRLDLPVLEAAEIDVMLRSIMSPRDIAEFEETGDVDWAYEIADLSRFRCNAGAERKGPMAVFRVIKGKIVTVDELGLSPEIQKLCYLTKGLVVVTGPTGSGKSTTLAGLVDLMNRNRSDHIITIEDPVEFVHQSNKCLVTQRQVGLHTRSFKNALRAALREDPDVILVGEMRDLETVSIAIETAETGHLVFGTLHTTTAASTVDRIIDQFPADRQSQVRVMLSESLKGVIAQVLCRRIGGGRVAAREVLLTLPSVANLIREGKTFQIPSIMQTNRRAGMALLNDALLDLVDQKQVEPKEAYLKAVDKASLSTGLKSRRVDTSFLNEA